MAETGKESVVENVLETTYKEEENSKQISTKEIIMNIEPYAAWPHYILSALISWLSKWLLRRVCSLCK